MKHKKIYSLILTIILIVQCFLTVYAQDYTDCLNSVISYLAENTENPTISSVGGEWTVIALARNGYKNPDFYETYYNNVCNHINEKQSDKISRVSSDNSRVILALTASGYDAANINGYNLFAPFDSFEFITKQGINGAIYALIALDTVGYPCENRDKITDYIISNQLPDGGWNLAGESSSPDITSMALQALSPYSLSVPDSINKALEYLSLSQNELGGYSNADIINVESSAQVLCALCALGIDINDERFVKNGNNILDNILSFYDKESSMFRHTHDGEPDRMATEQAAYSLVAYDRFINSMPDLYDMDAIYGDGEILPEEEEQQNEDISLQISDEIKEEYIPSQFTDISESKYKKETEQLAAVGIINGKTVHLFDPYSTMTRAEFAAIVVRALNLEGNVNVFDDVKESDWFYNYVCAAYSSGIINGVSETEFNPKGTITHEEAFVMCARAARLINKCTNLSEYDIYNTLTQFDDYTDISSWAYADTAFCYNSGIADNSVMNINPRDFLKRDEAAFMIFNVIK